MLAREVTRRVHGEQALVAAEQVSAFFFGELDPRMMSDAAFDVLRTESPFFEVDASQISSDGSHGTFDVLKLLTVSNLAATNGAAKRLLDQGGVSINRRRLAALDRHVGMNEATLPGGHIVVGKGRRDYAVVRVKS